MGRRALLALAVAAAAWIAAAPVAPLAAQPAAVPVEAAALAEAAPETVARVREAVYPALVNLTVVNQRFADGRTYRYPGAGSGVILTPEGHVLTNFHVAGSTARIEATLTNGRVLEAEVVVDDPLTDLSVLRLAGAPGERFPHARLGDSSRLAVGDTVFAMGNPLALSSSMTQGIVSNPARVFTDFTGTQMEELTLGEGELSGLFTRWIQHDALILPGNSGGPLVDETGEVVGINELGGGGMGFAIPADIAGEVLRQALATGSVERGWLGLSVLPVRKLGREAGALVSSVLPGSAAEAAGVRAGDVLVGLAGQPVAVRFWEEVPLLYQAIAALQPGAEIGLVVERGGERLPLTARVEEMEPFRGEEGEVRELGVTVSSITAPMALAKLLPTTEGVLLTGIRPGSPADGAKPPLQPDDVLLQVGERAVPGLDALRQAAAALPAGESFLVTFRRGQEELLSVLPAPRDDRFQWGGELPKAWLGVRTQVLTPDLAERLGIPDRSGYRVTQVFPGTEAAAAGLRAGDVLAALGDEPLEASRLQDAEDLRRRIEEHYIGDATTLTVLRDGAERKLEVTLEARPADADTVDRARQEELEFAVRDLTFHDRMRFRWEEDLAGVIVTEASRGGWAQMAGLKLDDLVMSIEGRPVSDVAAFRRVMREVVDERPAVVRIFVRRGPRTHFVLLEPDWDELFPEPS